MRSTRLYGGHRNVVYRIDSRVKIIWKDGVKRQEQLKNGVLVENFVGTHSGITSRILVDKSRPLQTEDGQLVTYFHFAPGEIRYPWNLDEIANAANLLSRLHSAINTLPPASPSSPRWSESEAGQRGEHKCIDHRLHLDFARGNVLFQPGTTNATGVIDFETTAKGPIEQELGRSLSFILVDTPAPTSFVSRLTAFLANYSHVYSRDDVLVWTKMYLEKEDYGDRNYVRDQVLHWLVKEGI